MIFDYEVILFEDILNDYFLPGLYGALAGLFIIALGFWLLVKVVYFVKGLVGVR